MYKYASGTRIYVHVLIIDLFYFYIEHNEIVLGEEIFLSYAVQFKARLHGITQFGHKRFITSGLCQSAFLSSTGVGNKYYISTTFVTGIIYCMHRAGGRDCTPRPDGRFYVGNKSVTKSGKTCQAWTSQSLYGDDLFPGGSRAAAVNYCRNPFYSPGGVWCITTNHDTELCDVPNCG